MKYIKLFDSHTDYSDFVEDGLIRPNVSHCIEDLHVHYNPFDPFNGHEYVDLGLPSGTLWATMNVGQTNLNDNLFPLFGWGRTTPDTGDEEDYYIKIDEKYNLTDKKFRLDLEDDAARVNWGGSWRIPTTSQFRELLDYTSHEFTGNWKFTSNVNGEVLYLNIHLNGDGIYSSSNPCFEYIYGEQYLTEAVAGLHETNVSIYDGINRREELTAIRPVINKNPLINDVNGVVPAINGYNGPFYNANVKDFVVTLTSPINGTIESATIAINDLLLPATTSDNLVFTASADSETNINGFTLALIVHILEKSDPIVVSAHFSEYAEK